MSGSGLGPASRLVPHCSCRSKLSSLESQDIRTPRMPQHPHHPTFLARNAIASSPLQLYLEYFFPAQISTKNTFLTAISIKMTTNHQVSNNATK
ncbi:hypothetical protein V6N12_012702 [Hibiscus sabdariffa]|uniref:Uncharacterized protein n=1 Tax=Hibiscus sabdariffa TaxID=183260 RepID=A0ABR2DE95_9ROSI